MRHRLIISYYQINIAVLKPLKIALKKHLRIDCLSVNLSSILKTQVIIFCETIMQHFT